MRLRAKRDANEAAIVDVLEAMGCSVDRLSGKGTPDLAVGFGGRHLVLIEVKSAKGRLTPDQERWRQQWNGPPPAVVRSPDEAVRLVNRVRMGVSET